MRTIGELVNLRERKNNNSLQVATDIRILIRAVFHNPTKPPAMQSAFFTPKVLKELRRVHNTVPPGNWLLFIGLPIVIVAPLLFVFLVYAVVPNNQQSPAKTKPAASDKSNKNGEKLAKSSPEVKATEEKPTEGSPSILWQGMTVCTVVGPLALAGLLIFVRHKLNAQFIKANTIRLTYPMERAVESEYNQLTRWFRNLGKTGTFQIVPEGRRFVDVGEITIRRSLPRYLDCDLDVYCLAIDTATYYLLPDCVLLVDGKYVGVVQYKNVYLAVNNLTGTFLTTEYHQQWVHSRADGGPDRRFKDNYQVSVGVSVTRSIQEFGVLRFRFNKNEVIMLNHDQSIVVPFGTAFQQWIRTSQANLGRGSD